MSGLSALTYARFRFDLCPVLSIRTDDLDFVHRPQHFEIVIQRMYDKLAGKEEVEFPRD